MKREKRNRQAYREQILTDSLTGAVRSLERKYGVKIMLENRERLYDIISIMEQSVGQRKIKKNLIER